VTVSYADLGLHVADAPMRETGREWFATLDATEQKKFFSAEAWKAYQAGDVTLDDFIGVHKSKAWGDAYVERSLSAILN
jgi:hypothetical protein